MMPFNAMRLRNNAIESLTAGIAYPLTYDEADSTGLTWTRQGTGPHITPDGFAGDGYQSRYRATASLPAFVTSSSGPLTLHASVTAEYGPRHATRDVVCSVCENDTSAAPKLGFYVRADSQVPATLNATLQAYDGSLQIEYLFRREWRYEFRFPELNSDSDKFTPQGLHFLDASTMLVSAYRATSNLSRVYKVRTSDGAVLGYFDFNDTDIPSGWHINAITAAPDGSIWMAGNRTLFEIDVDASLLSNDAEVLTRYDVTAANGSFLDIKTIGGTDYVVTGQYLESGTPYLYVFPYSLIEDEGTFDIADRTKRFVINQRVQGVNYDGGKLFMTMNRTTADGAGSLGKIQRVDLDLSAGDGTSITTAEAEWYAPSGYPEDLDFHPSNSRLYVSTEGRSAVRSDDGWLGIWSSALDGAAQENHVTAEYNGSGSVTIKLNNQLFDIKSWTPTATPAAITVGGPPQAAAGITNGFFIGHVRNIVIQDYPLTSDGYGYAINGDYEPNTLTTYSVTITNPGAESTTTGWTNEVGSLGNRASNPAPHSGASYFFGGANAQTIARQRFSIETVTGLSTAAIDAATMWARVNWWQTDFGGSDTDTASMGLRYLDGTPTQISLTYSGIVNEAPDQTWIKRGTAVSTPSGARNIDLVYRSDRNNGTNNDGYIDDITLDFYKQ